MSYCTQADLTTRFGNEEMLQLADPDGDGVIDAALMAVVLADADAEIDSYLGRYTLPLSTTPVVLTRLACDIVRYQLYGDAPLDNVRKRYEDAIKFLTAVSKGQVLLGLDATEMPAVADGNNANITSAGNVFARDTDISGSCQGDW